MRREGEASVTIEAPAESVWAVVADVTRVGEWSGECRGCTWLGGADAPVPGARFRGRNRRGSFRWTRTNEVVTAERPRELAWRTVPGGPYPDATEWHLELAEDGSRTVVRESFRIVKMPRVMEVLIPLAMPAHRDRSEDLAGDLRRLKSLVEGTAPATP